MSASLSVVVRPYWLGAWFLRVAATPFVVLDGDELRARWGIELRRNVAPGRTIVGAGIRYRGSRRLLGVRAVAVDVEPEEHVRLIARNGPLNSEPFRLVRVR